MKVFAENKGGTRVCNNSWGGSFAEDNNWLMSEMIHHHGASLSKQQTADLLLCHATQ